VMLTLLSVLLLGPPPQDEALLTRVQLVLDAHDWADVKASTFLPTAYGAGYLAGPAEVRLCDRLTCVVLVPADSATGLRAGDVIFGLKPVTGSALAERLGSGATGRARVVIAEPPAGPDLAVASDSLPMVYFLNTARFAVPPESLSVLEAWFRSAGARVIREGEGMVVQFGSQSLRITPAYGQIGAEILSFSLRRELPGNPTFRFGQRGRLRFGPGRIASWTF
jgi:hypothetical protein